MSDDDSGHLEWCKVTVEDGQVSARYKWSKLPVAGTFEHDEDVSDWNDEDVKMLVANMIGADNDEDFEKIEVVWQ